MRGLQGTYWSARPAIRAARYTMERGSVGVLEVAAESDQVAWEGEEFSGRENG